MSVVVPGLAWSGDERGQDPVKTQNAIDEASGAVSCELW